MRPRNILSENLYMRKDLPLYLREENWSSYTVCSQSFQTGLRKKKISEIFVHLPKSLRSMTFGNQFTAASDFATVHRLPGTLQV